MLTTKAELVLGLSNLKYIDLFNKLAYNSLYQFIKQLFMKRQATLPENQIAEVPRQQLAPSIQLSRTSADAPVYLQKLQEVYSDLMRMKESGELIGDYQIKSGDFRLSVKGDFTCAQNNPLGSALIIVGSVSIECEGNVDLRHLRVMVIDPEQPGFTGGKLSVIATDNCNILGSFLVAKTSLKAVNNLSMNCLSQITKDFFAPEGYYQEKGYVLPSAAIEQQSPSLLSYFEQPAAQLAICEVAEQSDAAAGGAHQELPADFG